MIYKAIFMALVVGALFWVFHKSAKKMLNMFGITVVDDRDQSLTKRQKDLQDKKEELDVLSDNLEITEELVEVTEQYREKNAILDTAEQRLNAQI